MDQIGQRRTFSQWLNDLYRQLRQFDRNAAALTIGFCGSESETDAARRRFDGLARTAGRAGAGIARRKKTIIATCCWIAALAMDRIETTASWSKLPARLCRDARQP